MKMIQIAYRLRIEGLQFNEIDFQDTTPEFKNIVLKPIDPNNYKYELLIKKNVYSTSDLQLEAMFAECAVEAERFFYIFSIAADVKIYEFECLGYYQEDKFIKHKGIFSNGTARAAAYGTFVSTAGKPQTEDIINKMKEKYDLSKLQMFYDSATIIEPIGRFISLYSLLLHKYDDKQKNVDENVLEVDPTISQFQSPKDGKIYETIFTKLRNELSHKRNGVNIIKTHSEVKLNIDRFEKIVKELILNSP